VTRDDPFSGGSVARRLFRMATGLDVVVRDAQCRDWVADRPDRVGFARLGQVRREVYAAARRYRPTAPRTNVPEALLMIVVAVTVPVLVAGWSDHPLLLAAAVVAGCWAAMAARAGWRRLRRFRARVGPAPIDDPYLYAGLRRQIEACAVAARADRSHRRRVAATDLEYALDWLAAAQDELPRGT
jgi:hypothetical protein